MRAATPSMALFASRVTGIETGSMNSPCAAHSAAIASARSRRGTASGCLPGVMARLPSSRSAKPPSSSAISTFV